MPAEPDTPDVPHVLVDVADGVAVLTLNRPDKLNAFTGRMGDELGEAYQACDRDDRVRAVVVTGAGRGFCAGADLGGAGETFAAPGTRGGAPVDRSTPMDEPASGDGPSLPDGSLPDDGFARPTASRPFTSSPVQPRAWAARKPVIAAINGPAVRIGLSLTMQCDLRYVAGDATLGFVHVRMGVLPDAPRTDRWPNLGDPPLARATVPVVAWRGRAVIPNGEARPGVRSPEVWSLDIK